MSNLTLRVLTALVGIPLILAAVFVGGWFLVLLVALGALLAQRELYAMMRAGGAVPLEWAGLVLGALVALRPMLPILLPLATLGVVLLIAFWPFLRKEGDPMRDIGATLLGVLYPTGLLVMLVDLREAGGVDDATGIWLTIAVFILVWVTDSFAYFVGRAVGKHPLAPRISPKKTWEGAVGGALFAVAAAAVLKLTVLALIPWHHFLVLALLCGVVSQFGDLAESHMKRAVGVKDSGTILPGHGGLLDRLDALILAAPLVYLYLAHVAQLFG